MYYIIYIYYLSYCITILCAYHTTPPTPTPWHPYTYVYVYILYILLYHYVCVVCCVLLVC